MQQTTITWPYSPAAVSTMDAIVVSLLGGPEVPSFSDATWAELEGHGDLDAWAELEEEGRIDWADPDAHDLDTIRWYDATEDPHARGPEPVGECEFMLGSHRPNWLHSGRRARRPAGPLFVSARQLRERRKSAYPACDVRFCVDSGGFTELRKYGRWKTTPEQYAAEVLALAEQTGTLDWAAIQDWMVEPDALQATGRSLKAHQRLSVESFLRLRELAPTVRWLPVLQGQTTDDYLVHLEMYRRAGVHLETMGRVGVGSVCRRQSSDEIADVLRTLAARGLRLHGFGVKTAGLEMAAQFLASSDSLAWSLGARKRFPGAQNSIEVAEEYRTRMLSIDGVC